MFLPARWWSDKNRVKAVFKLHFHITQMLLSGVDALVLSIVPGDIGKPTARLDKATTIRDGICRWENPVYETVKFVQDPKTGKISDKIYQFLVSTGLSKASPIGDASINFADYVETTKPFSVSLPIKNSHCDAVLHVSIQRIQENSDQREEDECEDAKLKSHDWILRNHLSNGDAESNRNYSSEDVSAKAVMNRAEMSVNCCTSSESDMTLSSSDDSSGLDSPRKLGQRKTSIHPNTNGFISGMSLTSESQKGVIIASTSMHDDIYQRSQWDRSTSSDHSLTIHDSTNGSQDAIPKERPQHEFPMENERLQAGLTALARQLDVSDMELQTLRKQILKETKRGQDLTKEIVILKEERDAFKTECDNLRSFHKRMDEAKLRSRSQLESEDLRAFVDEIRQELSYEKDMNANLRLQLKKMQESNAELVLAVQDLEEMLMFEQKNKETCYNSNEHEGGKNSKELVVNRSRCETDYDDEQNELEETARGHSNAKDTELLEKKIIDLYGEIDMYRRDKDELEMQMEQLALDYEILKQENHSIAYKLEQSQLQEQLKIQYECSSPTADKHNLETHIENLENQLKEQSEEFSNSLASIKDLEAHIRRLEEKMEKQKQGFEADVEAVTLDKVEQEQRAIRAEEALRKTRQTNAKTAERLQEEFRKLSMQMTSTFDANEKAAMRALAEARELRAQKSLMEEKLHKVKEELQSVKADYEAKLDDLSNQIETMTVQIRQMMLEIDDKSKELEDQKKLGEQVSREFSQEIRLLEAENENLKGEISCLREHVEGNQKFRTDLELMKKSVEEYETLLERGTVERNELVTAIVLLKMEAEESLNEVNKMRNLMDENRKEARHLQSELEAVRAQCSDMKHSLSKDEAEKEKLRKQVLQLKGELKKKEDALTSMERRFKDSNGTKTIPKNKKAAPVPQNSKEMAALREKLKKLQAMINSKETELETSKTSYLEKEKKLKTKIEELENKVEESNQIVALQKLVQEAIINSSNDEPEQVSGTVEDLNFTDYASEEKANRTALFFKSNEKLLEKEAELTELSWLKERNKSMESELKELQERYLEMSLKFAEVEGERQHLVMTLRNLKGIQKA